MCSVHTRLTASFSCQRDDGLGFAADSDGRASGVAEVGAVELKLSQVTLQLLRLLTSLQRMGGRISRSLS